MNHVCQTYDAILSLLCASRSSFFIVAAGFDYSQTILRLPVCAHARARARACVCVRARERERGGGGV